MVYRSLWRYSRNTAIIQPFWRPATPSSSEEPSSAPSKAYPYLHSTSTPAFYAQSAAHRPACFHNPRAHALSSLRPSPHAALPHRPLSWCEHAYPFRSVSRLTNVLLIGLYGFDVRGPSAIPSLRMHYWADVRNILRRTVGADVIVSSVPR